MNDREFLELEKGIEEINRIAEKFGLDPFEMRYEVCPASILYSIGAYGMPTRYSHWSFGKSYHRMKNDYDYGLSKIYELVVNSDPCYAFLLDTNSVLQNKLIVAHVLGHSDFFKNNAYFSLTNRDMIESMSVNSEHIKKYEYEYGKETVEDFIDSVMSISEHIDLHAVIRDGTKSGVQHSGKEFPTIKKVADDPYACLSDVEPTPKTGERKFTEQKDILGFIANNSKSLEPWQRHVIDILREEMYYFYPQIETKIMNEGWATFWHTRIMRELDLGTDELIEFSKMNSGVIAPNPYGVNPYQLGLAIFEDLYEKHGMDFIFEVRSICNDVSFIRNYLTKELVQKLDLFSFNKQGSYWVISDDDFENVKNNLITSRTNGGFPYLVISDDDYLKNGELYITHNHEGVDLDIRYLEKTLEHVHKLWGRPVHLETKIESRTVLFSTSDKKVHRRFL